jgi:hypothetical protein
MREREREKKRERETTLFLERYMMAQNFLAVGQKFGLDFAAALSNKTTFLRMLQIL